MTKGCKAWTVLVSHHECQTLAHKQALLALQEMSYKTEDLAELVAFADEVSNAARDLYHKLNFMRVVSNMPHIKEGIIE